MEGCVGSSRTENFIIHNGVSSLQLNEQIPHNPIKIFKVFFFFKLRQAISVKLLHLREAIIS